MSRTPARVAVALFCALQASAQVFDGEARPAPPAAAPSLPPSAVMGAAAAAESRREFEGNPRPAGPERAPALEGRPLGPSAKGPLEPEPTPDRSLLAAPVAIDKTLLNKLVTHVRKYCSADEDSGLCCLSGQSPLSKNAPNRTACLDIEVPQEEGDVHQAVYRETFVGLTLLSTTSLPKERRVEQVVLEVGMGGSVNQVEISSEGSGGLAHRANPMKPGETEPLFDLAAKDLLLIAPRIRIQTS